MSTAPVEIAVVAPAYKCSECIQELHRRLTQVLASLTDRYEIIFVDDGSPDRDWEIICELSSQDERVKGIKLSRNFGQHYAITAGLRASKGDWVVVMDGDLQDPPEAIADLFQKAQEGFDSVFAVRLARQDSLLKCWQSRIFYRVLGFLTETSLDHRVANFGIYHRAVISAILEMGDVIRYFPTMSQWVGFRKCYLPVVHSDRKYGDSSYSLFKLLRLASDTIIAFSDKPLRLFIYAGIAVSTICIVVALSYLYLYFSGQIEVKGYASLILSVWFIGGALLVSMGVIGVYLGKCFNQVKGRPVFIVAEKCGGKP